MGGSVASVCGVAVWWQPLTAANLLTSLLSYQPSGVMQKQPLRLNNGASALPWTPGFKRLGG